jgi:hypothetical protein
VSTLFFWVFVLALLSGLFAIGAGIVRLARQEPGDSLPEQLRALLERVLNR